MAKKKYAMSSDELNKELSAIEKCWESMNGLDYEARIRVVNWIERWVHQEGGGDLSHF